MNAITSVELTPTNMMIPLSSIVPLSFGNCRTNRNSESYQELLNSIKTRGVIQPILVRPYDDKFEIIAGYGRFEVSTELGLETIPAFVKVLTDSEALEHQLEENLTRSDLDIIDECKAVQQLSAFYNGDRKAIADRLVWPLRKVNERIEILRCTNQVLEAVRTGTITVGHALLLAPFSEKLQQGTLAKVISEKWTVAYLRERASKGQQLLALAKFDTQECNTCPHNSAAQSGLFGLEDHKAACSKLTCFKEKTNEWLEVRKDELADQYGTVLLIQQIAQEDRHTVDAPTVGEEQFNSGCMTCEKRVALIDDRLGRTLGTTYTNQCIDNICYSQCIKVLSEPEIEEVSEVSADAIELDTDASNTPTDVATVKTSTPKTAKLKKAVNCSVSSKVVETNKRVLRNVSASLLMPEPHFQSAMTYAALRRLASGYKPLVAELSPTAHFTQVFKSAMELDDTTLMAEIANVTLYLSTKQSDDSINFTDMMISALSHGENANEIAVAKWMPTKEILSQYTIDGIKVLCVESGFEAAFDSEKAGEFAKLTSKGKALLINSILKFEFDWTGFAPKEFIALIK